MPENCSGFDALSKSRRHVGLTVRDDKWEGNAWLFSPMCMKMGATYDRLDAQWIEKYKGDHEFIEWTKEEWDKFDKLTEPVRTKWLQDVKAKGIDGQAMLKEIERLKTEYTSKYGKK